MKNSNDNQQHSTPSRYRKQRRKQERRVSALALVCIICCLVSGLTLAFLVTSTDALENVFGVPNFDTGISEDFGDGQVKKDVKIQNTGDVDAYVRVMVVVTWVNDAGAVYPQIPVKGTDYTIEWKTDKTAWVQGNDDYWYYTKPIAPGGETAVLFTNCKPADGKAPDGYYLSVEILSQSIQAVPADAVEDAWKVIISENSVTEVTEEAAE